MKKYVKFSTCLELLMNNFGATPLATSCDWWRSILTITIPPTTTHLWRQASCGQWCGTTITLLIDKKNSTSVV